MLIYSDIKEKISAELSAAKSIWIASAMISPNGWAFLQKHIPRNAQQNYLVGTDLATCPSVLESLFKNPTINSRVFQSKYTFHPKVYLVQKSNGSFVAFIGSSNTTNWGLDKNVEMNIKTENQTECIELLNWFKNIYAQGFSLDEDFIKKYKKKFDKTSLSNQDIKNEIEDLKTSIADSQTQHFSHEQHTIFNEKFHYVEDSNTKRLRFEVRQKFLEIHNIIYPQFKSYGLLDLHRHHSKREIVSRHFFNRYSGNYINAIWLHYGKSLEQLEKYKNKDKSVNRPHSFINNARIQVIIHENDLGIWLVLGRSNGSRIDRTFFKEQMRNQVLLNKFFDLTQKLDNDYWIGLRDKVYLNNLKSPADLLKEIEKERIEEYFVIGCNINWRDSRLTSVNIATTILKDLSKLYPLYQMMKHT